MAGFDNRIRLIYYDDVGQVVGSDKTYTYTSGRQEKISEVIPGGTAPVLTLSLDVSTMKSAYLKSDRALAITVNDDGTPDATINLLAGIPVFWSADVGGSNPFGAVDVTSIKCTLGAGADSTLEIRALLDPTP